MNKSNYLKWFFFLIILALNVTYAYAQFAGGSGTQADPWQIADAEQLNNVRNYLGSEHADKFFIQTADISLELHP